MDTSPPPMPVQGHASPLLHAQAFAVSLAPRLTASSPKARMSLAVVGHGRWSFPLAAPMDTEPTWDSSAQIQILCDEVALHSVVSGEPIAADRLFLVSGDEHVLDSLGGLFQGAGTSLQLRMRGAL